MSEVPLHLADGGVVVTEAGSYLRLIDSCITQLKAQGPSWTCNESKEEERSTWRMVSTTLAETASALSVTAFAAACLSGGTLSGGTLSGGTFPEVEEHALKMRKIPLSRGTHP